MTNVKMFPPTFSDHFYTLGGRKCKWMIIQMFALCDSSPLKSKLCHYLLSLLLFRAWFILFNGI